MICGAAIHVTEEAVAVCERLPAEHRGLDHHDPRHGVSWPVCATYCPSVRQWGDPPERHACGRYRLDIDQVTAQEGQ